MPPYIRYADFEATDHQILKTLAALLEMHLDLRSMVNVSNLIFLHAFLYKYAILFVETHLLDSHRFSALLGAGDETQFKTFLNTVTVLHHFSYSLAADGQESSKLFMNFDTTCTV